ncbi:translation machinery-associated protein 16 [Marasmius crinis-equi]|uniref:Translation machinery-associated protein 16 n=1 Tax=Marasmius crinis-equi TaxID=585013 RepID=A0ABR3ESS2_9AGAR
MAPSKTGKSATSKPAKKEKIFHPESRKASQLNRKAVRKEKLGNLAINRKHKSHSLADFYNFFYHALPEEGVLKLEDLHEIIANVWLKQYEVELEQERATRRKGRPKSSKELKLEEMQSRELEEYRTGFEVIDLTHPPTVDLFRRWDQKSVAYIDLLRFIRISSSNPTAYAVSRPGKHPSVAGSAEGTTEEMEVDQNAAGAPPITATEPPERYSSTMMTMDEPIS